MKYFYFPFVWTFVSLILSGLVGYHSGGWTGVGPAVFLVVILGVLEISLSFDNAVANAKKLEEMSPVWQTRFMRWGIPIAVVGMRGVFPLVIISIFAHLGPVAAIDIAINHPDQYARILSTARPDIMAFGGTFLGMVGLKFMFDTEKDVHWISFLESQLIKLGKLESFECVVVLGILLIASHSTPTTADQVSLLVSGIGGLITYILVEALGTILDELDSEAVAATAKKGLSAFIFLEVMDASFSFDGVIGAFAITTSIFLIALGLGIGASYVRGMTLMLVKTKALSTYRYLEHGAFWAILVLYGLMMVSIRHDIPELVSGIAGGGLVFTAWLSSIWYNRRVQSAQ